MGPGEDAPDPTARHSGAAHVWLELGSFLVGLELCRHAAEVLTGAVGVSPTSPSAPTVWSLWTALLWTLLVLFYLRLRGERPGDLGLRAPRRGWLRALGAGAAAGLALWLILRGAAEVAHAAGLRNRGGILGVAELPGVVRKLVGTTVLGGFAEELVFRGYLLGRIERVLALDLPVRARTVAAVLVSNLVFAALHYGQGQLGVAVSFIVGCALSLVYLRCGRELPQVMIAHALTNVCEVLHAHAQS
jgi:membrane protease YdiL (CAAX protease family)